MFRPIRNKKREISAEAAKDLLRTSRRGVLAMNGEDSFPYAIPVNYLYQEDANRILFHSAKAGYKASALKACDKVCFTVIGPESIREEVWAPYVASTVVFGRCRPITDPEENLRLASLFAAKYYPDPELIAEEIRHSGKAVQMYAIEILHISGKEVQER